MKYSKSVYLILSIPFVMAYLSWQFFPVLVQWLVASIFGYSPPAGASNWLWYGLVRFFYTWYVFLAIGVAGFWAIVAWLAKSHQKGAKQNYYPMVSFVIPAYNEERNVSRCIASIFECAENYRGPCEIVVVDDGSKDCTYEIAWSTIELNRKIHPQIRGKVIRHSTNLGKVEAIQTAMSKVLGSVIAVVDADSWWMPDALVLLVDYMLSNGKKAVTGYVNPSDGNSDGNPYVILQQLEYSQGLGLNRCAQSIGDNVLIVSGAIGLYDAETLRSILDEQSIRSVTEDFEITLEMHKRGAGVGYVGAAASSSIVPQSFSVLWDQRLRWFGGWLHNTSSIHRDLLLKKSWITMLIWYCYVFEYCGAFVDLTGLLVFPFLFWYAPDIIYFAAGLLFFLSYGLLVGILNQAIALKYAYNRHNHRDLLLYTPFYPILRLVNVCARLGSSLKFLFGDNGKWSAGNK